MATRSQKAAGGALGTAGLILAAIFAVEGWHSDDPNDPGGATTWGCTEAVARENDYRGPMRSMPKSECQRILMTAYIEKPGYMPIVAAEPVLAWEIIDSGVNAGVARSSRWFQQALNTFSRGGRDYRKIKVDGQVGPATLAAYRNLQRVRGSKKACELMVKSADGFQIEHYHRLCDGSQALSSFCVGWIDHRIGNAPIAKCGTGSI